MAKTIFFALTAFLMLASSQAKHSVVAPGPTPAPMNLTAILEKGSQYTTLMRLLKETQVGEQIQNQLNNSFQGMTIFAPTDNAFNNLKPGTLNSLTAQEQVDLVLYHVLPRYYSLTTFETTSNPVSTQASDKSGPYTLNITSTSNQVNVSTGVDETQINNDLYSDFPLAVYSVDNVLLPNEIFGAKPPATAPAPSLAPKKEKPGKKPGKIPVAKGPAADEEESSTSSTKSGASSMKGKGMGWGSVVGIGLVCVGYLF